MIDNFVLVYGFFVFDEMMINVLILFNVDLFYLCVLMWFYWY